MINVNYYTDTYKTTYLEVTNDDLSQKTYSFNITTKGEYYIGVEFYNPRMYPAGCKSTYSNGYMSVLTGTGAALSSNVYIYDGSYNNYVNFKSLDIGQYRI